MNLSSKNTSASIYKSWEAPELDLGSETSPVQVQSEELLALFGMGQKRTSSGQEGEGGARSNIHSKGQALSLTNWLPDDIHLQAEPVNPEQWDFVETTLDSFSIAEPDLVKNKSETEKEKAKLLQDARTKADEILSRARAEADEILSRAQIELEQVRQTGYQEGQDVARNELQGALAATRELVQETQQWQASLLKEGEQILIGMLKELAQTMFGEGVLLDAEALQVNLNRIMENAQRLGDLNIFLHPRDANLLDTSWRDYQLLITGNKVRIIPSEKIRPGGCIIKGNMGMVDARVETQLASVLSTMSEVNEANQ